MQEREPIQSQYALNLACERILTSKRLLIFQKMVQPTEWCRQHAQFATKEVISSAPTGLVSFYKAFSKLSARQKLYVKPDII